MARRLSLGARSGAAIAATLFVSISAGPGFAQEVDCNRLQAAIEASAGGPARAGVRDSQYARTAQRQQYEIDRTRSYAESIGCGSQQAGIFADEPPPQCGAIEARIARMQGNLSQLESRSQQDQADGGGARGDLIARYNAACLGGASNPADLAQSHGNGFFDQSSRNPSDLRPTPDDPDALSAVPLNGDISDSPPERGVGKAICVRTCDGGYFPLAASATQDQLDGLQDLCKASCPNTEARLYTMAQGDDLSSATAIDGTPYTSLPAAFQFEKTFTPTCTCKPPNQSWVQALAEAEKLLGDEHQGDVTVTAKMSDELAKPKATPIPAAKRKGKAPKIAPASALPDLSITTEQLRGSQAPTASNASAGIAQGPAQTAAFVKQGAGPTRQVKGSDGVTKTVRIVAP
jgi:hypothetical protein